MIRSLYLLLVKVKPSSLIRFLMVAMMILIYSSLCSQTWNFIKEKDGIKIYTRTPDHSAFKCFKGETVFHTTMEKLSMYIGNVENVDWWDKNVREIKVLYSEPDKLIKYYLVYDVPWPLNDRDLCVEAKITVDPVTGEKVVSAKPLLDVVPEREGIVRIRNYWQKWTLKPIGKNNIQAVLEGFVDPGGNVPSWLYNMVIVDTPLKVMRGIKVLVEEKN
ncbi:MAG: hypothetical protein NTY96_13150 [Bacteroidetes bacterium]|nr:hypothetical protein [Bacteroidota bacterium]